MKQMVVQLVISALSLGVAASIVPGITVDSFFTLVVSAFLLGLVNAILRPVFVLLTLPITVLTLGIFLLVVNAAMLGLVAWLIPGFEITGFGSALLGWLIVAVTSSIASSLIKEKQ